MAKLLTNMFSPKFLQEESYTLQSITYEEFKIWLSEGVITDRLSFDHCNKLNYILGNINIKHRQTSTMNENDIFPICSGDECCILLEFHKGVFSELKSDASIDTTNISIFLLKKE
jgi:hypothetical protein